VPQAINEVTDTVTGETISERIEWTRESLSAHLAEFRYQLEIAGVIVSGVNVSTERGNERITWQYLMLQGMQNAGFTIRLKLNGEFITLNAQQCVACAAAGASYISACFAAEDVFLQQILSVSSVEEFDQIVEQIADLSNWPSRIIS
jgi:hypothetical protein